MLVRLTVVMLVGLLTLAGCGGTGMRAGGDTHWHTKVYRGTEGKVGNAKSIAHTSATRLTAERTRVSVTLPGLLPRGTYAWGVYQGNCDASGSLVGTETEYPVLAPGEMSQGSFTAVVNANFDPSERYNVTIFTNGGERETVLGCNELRVGTEQEFDEEEAEEAAEV